MLLGKSRYGSETISSLGPKKLPFTNAIIQKEES